MLEVILFFSISVMAIIALRVPLRRFFSARVLYFCWLLPAVILLLFPVPATPHKPIITEPFYVEWVWRLSDKLNRVVFPHGEAFPAKDMAKAGVFRVFFTGLTLWELLLILWIVGMLVTASVIAISTIRMYCSLKRCRVRAESWRRGKRVYFVENLQASFLFLGSIYIDASYKDDEESLRFILLHEWKHKQQGERMWSLLRVLLVVIFWFHPLVWVAVRLSQYDSEFACDEGVTRRMSYEERRSYATALYSMTRGTKPNMKKDILVSGMAEGVSLKKRICNVMKKTHKWSYLLWAAVLTILLVVWWCFCQSRKHSRFQLIPSSSFERIGDFSMLPETEKMVVSDVVYQDGVLSLKILPESNDIFMISERWLETERDGEYLVLPRKSYQRERDYHCIGGKAKIKQWHRIADSLRDTYPNQNTVMFYLGDGTDFRRVLIDELHEDFHVFYDTLSSGNYRMVYALENVGLFSEKPAGEERALLYAFFTVE